MDETRNKGLWDYFWRDWFHPLLVPPGIISVAGLVVPWFSDEISNLEKLLVSGISLGAIGLLFGTPVVIHLIDRYQRNLAVSKREHERLSWALHEMARQIRSGERPSTTFESADEWTESIIASERARAAARSDPPSQSPRLAKPEDETPDQIRDMLASLLSLEKQWLARRDLHSSLRPCPQVSVALETLIQAYRDALALPQNSEARHRVLPELGTSTGEVLGLMQSSLNTANERRADDVLASLRALQQQISQR